MDAPTHDSTSETLPADLKRIRKGTRSCVECGSPWINILTYPCAHLVINRPAAQDPMSMGSSR